MKKSFYISWLFLLLPVSVLGADGDVFISILENEVVMTFRVISETDKTCQVGEGKYEFDSNVGIYYTAIDKNVTGEVYVPAVVEGYKVVRIASGAFNYCSLNSIIIPEGVVDIYNKAFYECTNLSSVSLPEGLKSIGDYVFESCQSLASITLPESLVKLGYGVFSGSGITSLTIPKNVTSIGMYNFHDNITSVTCHCKNIGTWFRSNYNGGTCHYDSSVKEIILGDGVETIDRNAFQNCTNLEKVNIAVGVKVIPAYAFWNCTSLQSIQLPYGLKNIDYSAFSGCSNIKSIVIPKSVMSIGTEAFRGCNIPTIKVEDGNETYDSRGNCNAIIETKSNELILGGPNTVIPEGITRIGTYAFARSEIKSIVIPSSVKEIGHYAFNNCENLVEISIPASVEFIGEATFENCINLYSVKLHQGLKTIDQWAFRGCKNLSSIIIPEGVTDIGNYSFSGCSKLKNIVLPSSAVVLWGGAFTNCAGIKLVISKLKEPLTSYNAGEETAIFTSNYIKKSKLYVPIGSKDAYMSSKWWIEFGEIIEMDDDGVDNLTCTLPVAEYDGRNLSLTSNRGATIYYTTDGSEPTVNSERFVSPIAISDLCTIKAIAMMDGMLDSKVLDYSIPYCNEDDAIHIVEPGKLNEALEAYHQTGKEKLTVHGKINAADVNAIRQMPALRELDLQDLSFENSIMPDEFFSNLDMIVCRVQLASDVKSIGKRLFKGCNRLATVVWNGRIPTSGVLAEIGNPNLLLYVTKADDAPYAATDGVANIVVNGYASTVTLVDNAVGNANFYCLEPFTVGRIQYTHKYEMVTGYEACRGWETLALPFDVQSVEHETKGLLIPMIVNDEDKAPFWLYELTESGFVATDRIKANQPYIISMPNNMAYSNEYNLKGNVTFSAKDVSVSTTELIKSKEDNKLFVPCFEGKLQSPEIYALNVNEAYGGYLEGSVFVQNQFKTKPFGAYMTVEGGNAPALIPLFDKAELTGIKDINSNMIQGSGSKYIPVYNLAGTLVKSGNYKDVKKNLPKGVYIVNGRKVVIK